MFMCVRTPTHPHPRTHTHTHIHTRTRAKHTHARTHARKHARKRTHARTHTHAHARANTRTHARMYARTHARTHTHTHTHTSGPHKAYNRERGRRKRAQKSQRTDFESRAVRELLMQFWRFCKVECDGTQKGENSVVFEHSKRDNVGLRFLF